MFVDSRVIGCPYCGERIEIMIEPSIASQSYIEDCSVCCRPIELTVQIEGECIEVIARRDDD